MRLIDADKVLKEIAQRQKAYANPINEYEAACGDGIQTARYEIEEAPTIDAVPVSWIESQVDKGKWAELVQRWAERKG